MSISIKNIYYLLCYAWNKLDEKDRVAVSTDDCTELIDLLAKVLINSTKILLKRGIDKSYTNISAEFAGVKGKLELNETVKRHLLPKQKTVCSFDEFSPNILTNQVLVSTFYRLLKTKTLDAELKQQIKNLIRNFSEVEQIELKNSVFSKVKLHRNNKFYGFLLNVCRLIFENSLLNEYTGNWEFKDFTRDDGKMNRLFEEFVRNFYQIEQKKYRVKRENIYWNFSSGETNHLQFLPLMQTDITLENNETKIIIDAKYYRKTLSTNYDAEKISSANLYQLFSYVMNQRDGSEKYENTIGILIYPEIDKAYDLQYRYQNHDIFIKTVDLNANWQNIHNRLLNIIGQIAE